MEINCIIQSDLWTKPHQQKSQTTEKIKKNLRQQPQQQQQQQIVCIAEFGRVLTLNLIVDAD